MKERIELISDLLYSENLPQIINYINKIDDSEFLFIYSWNYNWDDFLDIPNAILDNKYCDLANALLLFYNGGGYEFLQNYNSIKLNPSPWFVFMKDLYERISKNNFKLNEIEYLSPLTKIQIFKLKKDFPEIQSVFFDGTIGKKINVLIM